MRSTKGYRWTHAPQHIVDNDHISLFNPSWAPRPCGLSLYTHMNLGYRNRRRKGKMNDAFRGTTLTATTPLKHKETYNAAVNADKHRYPLEKPTHMSTKHVQWVSPCCHAPFHSIHTNVHRTVHRIRNGSGCKLLVLPTVRLREQRFKTNQNKHKKQIFDLKCLPFLETIVAIRPQNVRANAAFDQ